jgi:hypothetical protein
MKPIVLFQWRLLITELRIDVINFGIFLAQDPNFSEGLLHCRRTLNFNYGQAVNSVARGSERRKISTFTEQEAAIGIQTSDPTDRNSVLRESGD